MHVSEAIGSRRAVKKFDPEHRLTEAEIERLFSLAIKTPTAFNIQNWRFVLVQDPELRRQIRAASFDQAQVTDGSLLVVLCADLKAWDKAPERYWSHVPPARQQALVDMIRAYYGGKKAVQRDEAMRSCGLAAMTLMLAAREIGYDTCPMDGFDFAKVGELINLPADHVIAMFVVIGKKAAEPRPRGNQLPLDDVTVRDRFA